MPVHRTTVRYLLDANMASYVIKGNIPRVREQLLKVPMFEMGNLDMMIAAQALAAPAVLVTHDHVFRRVKNLKVEDWTKAQ